MNLKGIRIQHTETVAALFSEPFGQRHSKSEAERKIKDTLLLKNIREKSQVSIIELLLKLDQSFLRKIIEKEDVIHYISEHGNPKICALLKSQSENRVNL